MDSGEKKLSDTRTQTSLMAKQEKRALVWLAERMPKWIQPDLLTFIGLLALAAVGASYYLAGRSELRWVWLTVASAALVLNWFGDSLDGTLARVRRKQRPKYGYYLDHLVDAFGTGFMLMGLAYSGMVSQPLMVSVALLYFILSINTYLATQAVGSFKISFSRLSPTEGRIALIIINTILSFRLAVEIAGRTVRILDALCVPAGLFLLYLILRSAYLNLSKLNREERAKWTEEPAEEMAGGESDDDAARPDKDSPAS